ncbi:fibronectin-like isoform X2 [Dermacentor variabilis]|uniref:fibronectin-like isoform X2 n=1 Tax=Dermacentor variabilis TaxID=34621 RepID=UPI003F5BFE57
MASPRKITAVCFVTVVFISATIQVAHAVRCPAPTDIELLKILHDSITFGWNTTEPNRLHCVCVFPGVYAETCSANSTPAACRAGVTGRTSTQRNLMSYYTHTVCVQAQCSPSEFSPSVCRSVYTLPADGSINISFLIERIKSSTLLVTWPEPDPNSRRFDSYIVSWWKANQTGADGVPTRNQTLPATSTSVVINNLEPGATYHVNLSTVREADTTDTSLQKESARPQLLEEPEDVRVESRRSVTGPLASITWNASLHCGQDSPVQRYTVKLCPMCTVEKEAQPTKCRSASVKACAGKAVFARLEYLCWYRVEVRALARSHGGNVSEEGKPTIANFKTPPSAPYRTPEGVRAEVQRSSNATALVSVTWYVRSFARERSSAIRYSVKVCPSCNEDSGRNQKECRNVAVPATAGKAVLAGLQYVCGYAVEVRNIVDEVHGTTDESKPAVFYLTAPVPNVPSLSDSLHAELSGSRVIISWLNPAELGDNAVLYHVTLFRPTPRSVVRAIVDGTKKTFDGLEPQENYTVAIAACLSWGQRQQCVGNATLEFETLPREPVEDFLSLTVAVASSTELRASWNTKSEDNNVKLYEITWWISSSHEASTPNVKKFTIFTHNNEITIDGLEPYITYAVQVVAVCERRNITWRHQSAIATATTYPEGLVRVSGVALKNDNCTPSLCDVSVTWKVKDTTSRAPVQLEYHVMLCIGSEVVGDNCRNETVLGGRSYVIFSGVKTFAALFATVRPVIKMSSGVFEGDASLASSRSCTPRIPGVEEVTVAEVTGTSAHASWPKVTELDGVDGGYYGVVVTMHPEYDEEAVSTEQSLRQYDTAKEKQTTGANSMERDVVVRNVSTSDVVIDLLDLKPWRNYTITVTPGVIGSGVAIVGDSASKVFKTLPEPPSKPRNVSVVERRGEHYVTWLPPESWNGPRSGYEVSVTCVNGHVRANSTVVAVNADKTELRVPHFSPGVPCTVSVRAYTVYIGEPLDGDKVRVRFTLPKKEYANTTEHSSM